MGVCVGEAVNEDDFTHVRESSLRFLKPALCPMLTGACNYGSCCLARAAPIRLWGPHPFLFNGEDVARGMRKRRGGSLISIHLSALNECFGFAFGEMRV